MWAHIPDPQRYPKLYAVVTSQMIHQCSPQRCLNAQKKCAKRFLKAFCPETVIGENQYPSYARPQDGFTYTGQRRNAPGQQTNNTFTNQHVIPYNPHLSMLLGCHVNVEFCANLLGSIKYIHKYIYKGPDHATIIISPDGTADEIHHYQDCHYISPPEAMWRILQFSLHGCTPNVYHLQLHLQGDKQVYFDPDQALPDVVQWAENRRSMLDAFFIVSALLCKFQSAITHYFQANQEYDFAKDVLYQDFPSYFTWKPKEMVWVPWKRGHAIGRIYNFGTRAEDRLYFV